MVWKHNVSSNSRKHFNYNRVVFHEGTCTFKCMFPFMSECIVNIYRNFDFSIAVIAERDQSNVESIECVQF